MELLKKWEDPPVTDRDTRGNIWPERLEFLKERPGTWALIGKVNSGLRGYLKRRYDKYEFANRNTNGDGDKAERGQAWLYARYIGERDAR